MLILLLGYVATSAGLGLLVRQQLQQQLQLTALVNSTQPGIFSSSIRLHNELGARVQFALNAMLQHGPILRSPPGFGMLRMRGDLRLARKTVDGSSITDASPVGQNHNGEEPPPAALKFQLDGSLGGHMTGHAQLPASIDLRTPQPAVSGPHNGLLVLHSRSQLNSTFSQPFGRLCLPTSQLQWQQLLLELNIGSLDDWLQAGALELDAGAINVTTRQQCREDLPALSTGSSTRLALQQLHIDLQWPAAGDLQLKLDLASWHSIEDAIGPLHLQLRIAQIDRAALLAWLQSYSAYQRQPATLQQLTLAAQTAALLSTQPVLHIEHLEITAPAGSLSLTGQLQMLGSGMRAAIHAETSATAARQILTSLLHDPQLAAQTLQQWQRLGVIQDLDGRWLIEVIVNQ